MNYLTCLLSAAILNIVLLTNIAIAQTQPSPAYTITSQSLLDNQCVDTPPLGDGFGWNGYCTCASEPADIAYEWSTVTALIGNQLIATSSHTPGQCFGSGSLSIYDWRGDQPPVKVQELVSSMPGARFGLTAEPLGTVTPIGLSGFGNSLAITNDYIAVRSLDADGFVTVFKRSGQRWGEDVILQAVGQDRGNFGSNMVFLDEQTLLIDESDALVIYNTSNWSSPQVIPIEARRILNLETAGDGFVLYRTLSNNGADALFDYFVKEGSAYIKKQTLNGAFSSISGNYLVSEIRGPLALQRRLTVITRELNSSGLWVDVPNATLEFDDESLIESVHLVDDQLVLSTADGIQIYELSNIKSWNLVQQININSIAECDSWCSRTRYSTQTKDGRIIANNNALVSQGVTAHTIYGRNESGVWTDLQTITVPQSRFYTPHFSLIDDIALVELTASPESPSTSDRSTVAVFNIPSQTSSDSQCDYSSADLFGGWGWNATTNTSCAPLTSIDPVLTTQCIDADGDGYGWDGMATCTTQVNTPGGDSNCDYSDADLYGGWGWNAAASQSCAPLEIVSNPQPSAQCIDTDGDGWGWDGSASCRP